MTDTTSQPSRPAPVLAARWVPVGLAALSLALLWLTGAMFQGYPPPEVGGAPFRVFREDLIHAAYWGAVAAGWLVVAWCVWRRMFLLAALIFFFGYGIFGMFGLFGTAGRCVVQETRAGPDGRDYIALTRFPFLPPAQYFLGTPVAEDMFSTTYSILGEGSDEPPHGFTLQPADDVRRLRALDSGTMIVISGAYVVTIAGQRFGHDVAERVPPFRFMGAIGAGVDSDVDDVITAIADVATSEARSDLPTRAIPRDDELVGALSHPNAWVREAARRFIAAGGAKLYPEAVRAAK